jgi:hypothetical protein
VDDRTAYRDWAYASPEALFPTHPEIKVPLSSTDAGVMLSQEKGDQPAREIRHEYTHSLPPLLGQLGLSLLVSTSATIGFSVAVQT